MSNELLTQEIERLYKDIGIEDKIKPIRNSINIGMLNNQLNTNFMNISNNIIDSKWSSSIK